MANIKSAKKQAKQAEVKRKINLARSTAIKSAIKKVLVALEEGQNISQTKALLRDAQAKMARACGKRLMHSNTSSRKIGRLAHKVAAAERTASK
ncbi:MAG TPA: 30S ribosomal protein S20 [Candidatus Limnocylindria bacterium]|nr:30S ribosomal protein S20 [Candidatus Limnocylindria bacterium]